MPDMREEFEAWVRTQVPEPSLATVLAYSAGNDLYLNTHIQGRYEGWKASRAALRVEDEIDRLKAENDALRKFSAEAYQVLGALDAPENVLDNASDAANGVPLRHETLLPFLAEDYEALRKDAERYRALRQKERGIVVVSNRTSHLFGEHLDAANDAAIEGATQ